MGRIPGHDGQDYVELGARSAFSFLAGASEPETLAEAAAELGHEVLALADRDGVYGIPRFHHAASASGLRAIVGAELRVGEDPSHAPQSLRLLVESPRGWKQLCALTTLAHAAANRADGTPPSVSWSTLEAHAEGLTCLVPGDASLVPESLVRTRRIFGSDALRVGVARALDRHLERALRRAAAMAESMGIGVVATGDVRCARARERPLLDALTCLGEGTTLDGAGRRLLPNAERILHSRAAMARRFHDHPEWIRATREVAERCAFTLGALDYRFPEYPLRPGETQSQRLRALTWQGARERYGASVPKKARRQIEHELDVIERLDLAGYFLIVHDITSFARTERILCQGRGSAANSAVCFALGITAVDPVRMELLFERFLSEERGEWPDIDIDFPSGDQRERVIQYVFAKYGEKGAAMTANVITYRMRMAVREMGKVLGMSPEVIDRLSKGVARLDPAEGRGQLVVRMQEAGIDPEAPRARHWMDLIEAVQGLPRHLGQHSGGIVIAAGRLDQVVPIQPATMEGRRIVQWDKDDCADLGIIKIDLLGLGMLAALEETIPLVRQFEGIDVSLHRIPPDDPATYDMICEADTVGVFQIESRAQMATLPRLKPRRFYDLVVEIAIIRPGPIVGQMVHPYLNRRAGREPVHYPHPSLEPILERTLGVPLFQEQLLRIAMTAAGFSGGEAEELRRAMGFKRSVERMHSIEARLHAGMTKNGFSIEAQEEIVRHITAFALYGFPESHSASFALIAYASSYLKRHHPAAFLVGLLNAQPMGFYNPATLVKDAQRHGVEVRPIDVTRSDWKTTLERGSDPPPAVRIGLRHVAGLRQATAERLMAARAEHPFESAADLVHRVALQRDELDTLAELGALASLPGAPSTRRAALWQVAALERDPTSLFSGKPQALSGKPQALSGKPQALSGKPQALSGKPQALSDKPRALSDRRQAAGERRAETDSPLPEMSALEETLADYRLGELTTRVHVMAHFRDALRARGLLSARDLREAADGSWVRTAGHAIVRQRPGSAKGFLFLTLEDETGLSNGVLTPDQAARFRVVLHQAALLEIAGPLQKVDGVIHVRVRELRALDPTTLAGPGSMPRSHDYR